MRTMADCSSDWLFRHHSLHPPLLIWAPSFLITFHIIYCFICLSTIVVQSFHFCMGIACIYSRRHHWVKLLVDQTGCSDRSFWEVAVMQGCCVAYAGVTNNNFKTVQLAVFCYLWRKRHLLRWGCMECIYNTFMVMTLVGNTVILGWNVLLWKHMGQVTGKYIRLLCLLL